MKISWVKQKLGRSALIIFWAFFLALFQNCAGDNLGKMAAGISSSNSASSGTGLSAPTPAQSPSPTPSPSPSVSVSPSPSPTASPSPSASPSPTVVPTPIAVCKIQSMDPNPPDETTSASIKFALTSSGGGTCKMYCRLIRNSKQDGTTINPVGDCTSPFSVGMSNPFNEGTYEIDFYLDSGSGYNSNNPTVKMNWKVSASTPTPTPTPSPSPSPIGGPSACSNGVTPLAMIPYTAAGGALDGGLGGSPGFYNGTKSLAWNGNVMLGPTLDPNGSGRTVDIHRIMEAATAGFGTTHRSELMWENQNYDLPLGVDVWQAFAVMRKPGESLPATTTDDGMLVFQAHSPLGTCTSAEVANGDCKYVQSGCTYPPYSLVFSMQHQTVDFEFSYNSLDPSQWGTDCSNMKGRTTVYPPEAVEPIPPEGVWFRYIIHMRSGFQTSHNPIFQVWRAKPGVDFDKTKPLFTYTGFNAYNNGTEGNDYPRIGLYKWDTDWRGQASLAYYMTGLYYGRGTDLFDRAAAALCGIK